ncbi:MAG: aldo/keto reductase [Acidobacteriota bacterium]|nr:aldo/keto reductase [Acidobacteriota bacterium]
MNRAVERVRLAPGLEVSRILTGLWQVADQERDGAALETEKAAGALEPAVDAGFTTVDVADHYGSAELIAGALRKRRPEARVLTKWVPEPGVSSRTDVEAAIQRSLDRIGASRLDALQFHAWSYPDPGWLDCLFHLVEIQAEGRIGHLGVTNFDAVHLDLALRSAIPLVSNQVCYSLIDRRPAGRMTEVCGTHGIGMLVYGTLAGGLLSDRWLGAPEPPIDDSLTWSQMKYRRFVEQAGGWDRFQAVLRAARRVADRYGVSIANVAVRYVLEQPAVAGVIVGARPGERSHLEDNRRLFDFSLDERSRAELAEAQEALDSIPGDCGDEYRRPPYLTASGDLHHHVTRFPAPYAARGTERGVELDPEAGFGEAVRTGDDIRIAGVTPTHRGRLIGGDDIRAQTHSVVDRIEGALQSFGAQIEATVRIAAQAHEEDWPLVKAVLVERFPSVGSDSMVRDHYPGGLRAVTPHRVEMDVEARA